MMLTKNHRRWIGASFWSILILVATVWMLRHRSMATILKESITLRPVEIAMIDPTGRVRLNDVVFGQYEHGNQQAHDQRSPHDWREIGFVSRVDRSGEGDPNKSPVSHEIVVTLFERPHWDSQAQFRVHHSSGSIDEIMATLLPPDRREALQERLSEAMDAHLAEVTDAVLPLVLQSLQESVPVIEQGIVESVERHRDELESLAARYRADLVQDQLVPLVRAEVIPIVRRHGQVPAEEIGREIWNKASLWRFGWRAIYDKSPLPERELVQEEWRRFVDQEVVPTVEDHLDEIATAVELIMRDILANERVRDEMMELAGVIANDEEARELFRVILSEAVIDNAALRQVWTNVWSTPEAKHRLQIAGKRIEPILRQIGDEIMGTREGGIEPGFARVLRNQILGKDRTWITIGSDDGASSDRMKAPANESKIPRLTRADTFMPYPVVHLANPKSANPKSANPESANPES
ncbi:hypothetical protein [Neorhodopirellula pilleata]|uniref:Uncharacterized protein n=1 Tax=Neorhodopirellula pilleata TaxID=2714738 RepID=A0A5C6A564_9BACT|nr:hypothetical protein [Neorhodopirellula pilleata]TWT95112.1 hypothetical protein Pla100_36940 [Neorhodopirellula pilleata]